MTKNKGNIYGRQLLSESELKAIRELEKVCSGNDGIKLKLNWDILISRQPGTTDDFLYFDESGKLMGFLAIYCFGKPEAEISGMVHPSLRGNGIFSRLLEYALVECRRRSVNSLLFINDRNSVTGSAFVKAAGAAFDHSEHRMELPGSMSPIAVKFPIKLRKAGAANLDMLVRLSAVCFDMTEEEAGSYINEVLSEMDSPDRSILSISSSVSPANAAQAVEKGSSPPEMFVSVSDGTDIGMLRLNWENDDLMIYGFGILPEFRGKGYGRATLGAAVNLALQRRPSHIGLEVDCINDTALSLYKSCGFSTTATYDYYRLAV